MANEPPSEQHRDWRVFDADRASPASLCPSVNESRVARHSVIGIIPPRHHHVDEAAAERLFASLGNDQPVSAEIGADAEGIRFLLRGHPRVVSRAQHQVQAIYDQASFRPLAPEDDPARMDGIPCATAKMELRKPHWLPLVTFREGDFLTGDPLRGMLGAFSHLEPGEHLLSQLILTSAARSWADRYAGFLRPTTPSASGEPLTMPLFLRQIGSLTVAMLAIAFFVRTFLAYLQRDYLLCFLLSPPTIAFVGGFVYLFLLTLEQQNLNPELVQRKLQSTSYDVSLRLVAFAPTQERAREQLHELALAYRQFDLASGNALIARRKGFDPQVLEKEPSSFWNEFTGSMTRLNCAELAALWHLPVDKEMPLVERTLEKRLLPRPATVREGVLIGTCEHQGRNLPVRLEPEALSHHMFMVAKTQKGKSTLMAHLAAEAMRRAERTALLVIDPHGDLARSLLGLVSRERVGDVVYIDFSDAEQVVGLNLLDVRQGRNADAIVSNITNMGELIWKDYWGPRMEDALRMALRTLLAANEKLAVRGEPQFTLIDIPALYELANFRHRLLKAFVTDGEIIEWWEGYFERLYESLRMDVINPVLTKIHRFSTHSVVRNIVGQSHSTVNFRSLLSEHKILLVNTATGVIGPGAGGLLGAVVLDYLNFAVREQMRIPDPNARARGVVVMDEFQAIPGVDYPGLLAELHKMGASVILATQSLAQLDAINRQLRRTIVSNCATLFVFQTSAEDAELLRHELDESATTTDIINLPDYGCYIKSQLRHQRLPVMSAQTLSPSPGDPIAVQQVMAQMPRYAGSAAIAEAERNKFKQRWYGRDLDLLLDIIGKGGRPVRARGSQDVKDVPPLPGATSALLTPTSSTEKSGAQVPSIRNGAIPQSPLDEEKEQEGELNQGPSKGNESASPNLKESQASSAEESHSANKPISANEEVAQLEEELRRLELEHKDQDRTVGGMGAYPRLNP